MTIILRSKGLCPAQTKPQIEKQRLVDVEIPSRVLNTRRLAQYGVSHVITGPGISLNTSSPASSRSLFFS